MNNIYQDIATRTNGEVYIGVVGPVRVGKSTFITKFMQNFVLPNMQNDSVKTFTIDELPQSADGVGIMTTQPKFVPAKSVRVNLDDSISANVRLIDCVGYLVEGAQGDKIDGKPRMVNTPWSNTPMPFEDAAEIGTHKVVSEHSTVAVLVTTDGSFGNIPRNNYIEAEKRLVTELNKYKKPFAIVLNSAHPQDKKTVILAQELEKQYNARVIPLNATTMEEGQVAQVFEGILQSFDVTAVEIDMPQWLTALPFDDPIIQEIATQLSTITQGADKVVGFANETLFLDSQRFMPLKTSNIDMGKGVVTYTIVPKPDLFYNVLSGQCGMEIKSDYELVANIKELAQAKLSYDKLKDAISSATQTGYGVVQPDVQDLEFLEPELTKQGGKWGVRLRANAPSLHIMRVDLETEISPIVGSEEQSKELIEYINKQREESPSSVWQINMFGRSLQSMMTGGLENKINAMPIEAQRKMRKTLTRIVNEGKGGIICILL